MSILWAIVKPLAYLSVPVILLRSFANSSQKGRYYVRAGTYVLTLAMTGVWAACVAAGMSLIGRQYDVNYVVAQGFYFLAGRSLGIDVQLEGEEYLHTRPAVLMCNHQSIVDVLVLGRLMPKGTSIMAKKELKWSPLGAFMSMSGSVFVDRGNNAHAVRSMQAAGEGMRKRRTSLWMYPEGTRTSQEEPNMISLKKGGFYLAIQAGIPIVPVVTENYWRLYHHGVFESGTVKVRVLPPIPTDGLTTEDVAELAVRVRDQMLATLREISVKVPPAHPPPAKASDDNAPPEAPTPIAETSPLPSPSLSFMSENAAPFNGAVEEGSAGVSSSGDAMSFSGSDSSPRKGNSETGTETEEEEGMIIVGRPT